ncbi:hypothetical protein OHR68_05645 [Spirillospora sp. NBC_00431]
MASATTTMPVAFPPNTPVFGVDRPRRYPLRSREFRLETVDFERWRTDPGGGERLDEESGS